MGKAREEGSGLRCRGGGRFCVPSPYWPRLQLGLPVFTIVVPEVPVPSAAHDPHQTPAGAEGAGAG